MKISNTAHNKGFVQVGLTEFYETFVLNQTLGILISFGAKMPHLHKTPKR
jgi:hypothetical protein